jgi:hypothetical protein
MFDDPLTAPTTARGDKIATSRGIFISHFANALPYVDAKGRKCC